jgi:MIT (microtubule interacting and transport) domain
MQLRRCQSIPQRHEWRSQPDSSPTSPPSSFPASTHLRRYSANVGPPRTPPPTRPLPRVPNLSTAAPIADTEVYFARTNRTLTSSGSRALQRSASTNTLARMPKLSTSSSTETLSDVSVAEPKPFSMRTLSKALKLAKVAVKLDTDENNFEAITAYRQSITLLGEVLQQLGKGKDEAQEEEVKRLKRIVSAFSNQIYHSLTSIHTYSKKHTSIE